MDKSEIFDWIMTCEDEKLKDVREEVIKSAEYNFGETGRKVAEYYYKKIDGEDVVDEDIDDVDVDCNDCAERAKRLAEISDSIKDFMDILTSELSTTILKDVDLNEICKQLNVDSIVDRLIQRTIFKLSDEQKDNLKRRLLLELACRKEQNGC